VRADGERVRFTDRSLGVIDEIVDDFVVRRADGIPTFHAARGDLTAPGTVSRDA
jgi:hypothetical protein